MTQATSIANEEIEALLSRLQTKQTVQSVLVLERQTGSIIRSSGNIASRSNEDLVTEYAGMVWNFLKSAEDLVNGMNEDDALKLLRVRTKMHELCIVPDPKFLLIVIHDTPQA
ncbi:hypothetical protein TWF730_007903 [Orbilia blumenaviensis]|uniref:Roadblock/LAMTOR2 domain-containing protein n=1 Tax=Orbilia blumenaviensis TaxID=1796055 RepID=A0AAV9VB05_9PEZI